MISAFVRTLALVVSATLLFVLAVFAAAQGALDGNPATLAYWAKWWPIWLLLLPLLPALAMGITGRARTSLACSAAVLLLVGVMVLVRTATIDR